MSIELTQEAHPKTLFIYVGGRPGKADQDYLLPEFERLVAKLWEEIKFDVKHFSDFERIAVIGDKKWEEVMTCRCKCFTCAELGYFPEDRLEEARKWLNYPY